MKAHIEALVELCKEQPFSVEKIQGYISRNAMDSEAVTRAALALCEYGEFDAREYEYRHGKLPEPEELVTHNWETLFDLLLANGLDAQLVICDDGRNYENILQSIQYLDDGDLNARIARNILRQQGTPNVVIDGISFFREIDGDLMMDILMGLYHEQWMQDAAFRFWLVLVGFGGVSENGKSPVEMREGYSAEIFRDFEKYDYRILWKGKDFDMEIFEKESGTVVATA